MRSKSGMTHEERVKAAQDYFGYDETTVLVEWPAGSGYAQAITPSKGDVIPSGARVWKTDIQKKAGSQNAG